MKISADVGGGDRLFFKRQTFTRATYCCHVRDLFLTLVLATI